MDKGKMTAADVERAYTSDPTHQLSTTAGAQRFRRAVHRALRQEVKLEAGDLVKLTGSPRQVEVAEKVRMHYLTTNHDAYLNGNPALVKLRKAVLDAVNTHEAKWWLDGRAQGSLALMAGWDAKLEREIEENVKRAFAGQ